MPARTHTYVRPLAIRGRAPAELPNELTASLFREITWLTSVVLAH
jgi:hypothetical protein